MESCNLFYFRINDGVFLNSETAQENNLITAALVGKNEKYNIRQYKKHI